MYNVYFCLDYILQKTPLVPYHTLYVMLVTDPSCNLQGWYGWLYLSNEERWALFLHQIFLLNSFTLFNYLHEIVHLWIFLFAYSIVSHPSIMGVLCACVRAHFFFGLHSEKAYEQSFVSLMIGSDKSGLYFFKQKGFNDNLFPLINYLFIFMMVRKLVSHF